MSAVLADPEVYVTCMCQHMAQWCRTGQHQHCRCPHAGGFHAAEAILTRGPGGGYVIDAATGTWLTLHLVPKPCRLHEVCRCECHRPAPPVRVRLVQPSLFDP